MITRPDDIFFGQGHVLWANKMLENFCRAKNRTKETQSRTYHTPTNTCLWSIFIQIYPSILFSFPFISLFFCTMISAFRLEQLLTIVLVIKKPGHLLNSFFRWWHPTHLARNFTHIGTWSCRHFWNVNHHLRSIHYVKPFGTDFASVNLSEIDKISAVFFSSCHKHYLP